MNESYPHTQIGEEMHGYIKSLQLSFKANDMETAKSILQKMNYIDSLQLRVKNVINETL